MNDYITLRNELMYVTDKNVSKLNSSFSVLYISRLIYFYVDGYAAWGGLCVNQRLQIPRFIQSLFL